MKNTILVISIVLTGSILIPREYKKYKIDLCREELVQQARIMLLLPDEDWQIRSADRIHREYEQCVEKYK